MDHVAGDSSQRVDAAGSRIRVTLLFCVSIDQWIEFLRSRIAAAARRLGCDGSW